MGCGFICVGSTSSEVSQETLSNLTPSQVLTNIANSDIWDWLTALINYRNLVCLANITKQQPDLVILQRLEKHWGRY